MKRASKKDGKHDAKQSAKKAAKKATTLPAPQVEPLDSAPCCERPAPTAETAIDDVVALEPAPVETPTRTMMDVLFANLTDPTPTKPVSTPTGPESATTAPPKVASPSTDGRAVTTLVFGLIALMVCLVHPFISIILLGAVLIVSHGVRASIEASHGARTGNELLITGLICGWVGGGIALIFTVAIASAGLFAGLFMIYAATLSPLLFR